MSRIKKVNHKSNHCNIVLRIFGFKICCFLKNIILNIFTSRIGGTSIFIIIVILSLTDYCNHLNTQKKQQLNL